jgi:sulfite exporter TauE/SafE
MIPTSRLKGRVRLASSLLVGAAFPVMAISQGVMQRKPLLSVVELIAGAFLVWLGLRKYRRDPEGRTPSAQIL